MHRYVLFVVIVFAIVACCTRQAQTDPRHDIEQLAAARAMQPTGVMPNADSSYSIVMEQPQPDAMNPHPFLKFFVYSHENGKVIFEDNLASGKIEWLDATRLRVSTTPGIVSEAEESKTHGYIFDCSSLEKKSL